jgi:cell wall-associated NlpC family hydrolase
MSLAQRRGLNGRADTQALLGDRVLVLAVRGSWAQVVVPDQPTPLDSRGYPGWLPVRQLSPTAPKSGSGLATVVSRSTWLRTDDATTARVTEVGYGTRLPVLGTAGSGSWVRVALPGGAVRRVSLSVVSRHAVGAPAVSPSGASVVRAAQSFTGLPYLWAGRSGFGFDCSGLTSLVYRVHGITIPRDADAQATRGMAVSAAQRSAGDLLFYATPSGYVHHVSLHAGSGMMVQSPSTGKSVETIPVSTSSYAVEYAGARRYLP